jgi:hypothetical protein
MMELSPAVCRVVSAMNPRPMQTRGSSVPSQRSGRQKTNCTNLNITQNGASAPDAVQRRAVAAVERHVVVVGFDGGAITSDASALLSGAKRLIEHGSHQSDAILARGGAENS